MCDLDKFALDLQTKEYIQFNLLVKTQKKQLARTFTIYKYLKVGKDYHNHKKKNATFLTHFLLSYIQTINTDSTKHLTIESITSTPVIQFCQKLKHCSTFLIYNDVHYHISSVVISRKLKEKQTEMTDAPSGDRSRERDYITREREEEEEDQRERTPYIDYLYVTSLLCNPVLRRTAEEALSLL